jgi:hypothetical protein
VKIRESCCPTTDRPAGRCGLNAMQQTTKTQEHQANAAGLALPSSVRTHLDVWHAVTWLTPD